MVDFTQFKKVDKPKPIEEAKFDFSKFKKIDSPTIFDFTKLSKVSSAGTPLLPAGKTQEDITKEGIADKERQMEELFADGDSINTAHATREQELPQIESDEGVKDEAYLDTLKRPTGGKGHLLTKAEQKKYPVGTKIPKEVIDKWYEVDVQEAHDDVDALVKKYSLVIPEEVEKILFNMVFNLGRAKLAGFKKMLAHLANNDYQQAADEMIDSAWYKQVGDRSKRLVERMRGV